MTTPHKGTRPPADMTTEELVAELDDVEAARLAAKERGRALKEVLHARLDAENAALQGLTPEGYQEAKRYAKENDLPLASVLSEHRRARALQAVQVAKATPAQVGAKAKDTGKK